MGTGTCDPTLAGDLTKNCSDPLIGGVEKVGYLFNKADIDIETTKASLLAGSNNIYEDFTVESGAKGYEVSNVDNYVATKVDGTYVNKFNHVVTGVLLDDGDVPGSVIDSLSSKDGEFIMVIMDKFNDRNRTLSPSSSVFHIIGLDDPLTCEGQEIVNDKNSKDTQGGWMFGLGCSDTYSRTLWYKTGYAETKVLFDALGSVVA